MSNRILDDIAGGNYAGIYVLYGEEDYLKRYYRDRLRKSLIREGDEINLNIFQGTDVDVREVIAQANTLPFFSDHRLIILQDCNILGKSFSKLADYLPSLPAETILLIIEGKIEKKNLKSRMIKAIQSCGGVLMEQRRQSQQDLMRWIAQMFHRAGKKVTRQATLMLIEYTCSDMESLVLEIDKLTAYTGERDAVTGEDVAAVATVQMESRIFDLMDVIAQRQETAALRMYRDLLGQKVSPVWIISQIGSKFTDLYKMKQLRSQGFDRPTIAEKVSLPDFVVGKTLRQCEYFSLSEMHAALRICLQADEDVKYGRMKDDRAGELALVRICRIRAA